MRNVALHNQIDQLWRGRTNGVTYLKRELVEFGRHALRSALEVAHEVAGELAFGRERRAHERIRPAAFARAARAPDAVRVCVNVVRHLVVDHDADRWDVQTARRHVCRHQHRHLALPEPTDHFVARRLDAEKIVCEINLNYTSINKKICTRGKL